MFEKKPEHPFQVGAIDTMCNVNDVIEGIMQTFHSVIYYFN